MPQSISVLGAGSWGTALALLAAKNGCSTLLWGHDQNHIKNLLRDRENKQYLPSFPFPDNLSITSNLQELSDFSDILLLSIPSHAFEPVLNQLKPFINRNTKIAWATKGFYSGEEFLLSHIVEKLLSKDIPKAILSGPTFAKEVAAELPTAITIASNNEEFSNQLASMLHNEFFRPYTSRDIIGVQVGGATKNILAIAAGIADGLGFGANTRSALITRGLQEIIRLGKELGGQTDTFMGLAGLGDLILTCTDNQSRNRRFGLAIGQGKNKQDIINEIGQEIEGIAAAKETYTLANKMGIDMPIVEQTYQVLYENLNPLSAVQNLLARQQKAEY